MPKPVALLNEDGDLSAQLEQALKEIFARYDQDKDGALKLEELHAFARFCNGEPFSQDEVDEILEYFDTTDDGKALTLEGFYQLYQLQTASGRDEETWRDLRKHDYNDQLQREAASEETPSAPSSDAQAKPENEEQEEASATSDE
ncbi:hypothetical protein H4R34_001829 [Dimargaris verticillata]|uniref:EF-hand domain-containing protein n=1 Tax=Dimargaris verticillata TaxID=2761393 RepID=A0A9W8B979_9FUNG|nr:hypothetical protein H4R34_001829 [Dimargaris verticillata]